MKKEVIIAIIGGFILGLIITFGIATAQNSLKQQNQKQSGQDSYPTPVPTIQPRTLFIISPQPNSVVTQKTLRLSGSTVPNSMVSVVSANDFNTTVADDQGNFSFTINLVTGANILNVSSFTPSGENATTQLDVVYTQLDEEPTPTPTP